MPPKPFTWRSTKPGEATPLPLADGRPTRPMWPSTISTSPGTSSRPTRAASTPSLTSRAPPVSVRRPHRAASARCRRRPPRAATRSRPWPRRPPPRARPRPRPATRPWPASTMRRTRARSLSFVARTSTMRLPKVFPMRTIDTVEIVLRTSFCAVPAFSRVEPARNSGPTTTTISWSTSAASGESGADTTAPVSAPAAAAASIAPTTNGVRPLALMPSTASAAVTAALGDVAARRPRHRPRQRRARRRKRARRRRRSPPPAGRERERRLALGRIERRDRARRPGADVEQPAAAPRDGRRRRRSSRRSDRTPREPPAPRPRPRRSSARRARVTSGDRCRRCAPRASVISSS